MLFEDFDCYLDGYLCLNKQLVEIIDIHECQITTRIYANINIHTSSLTHKP
ncbi:Uncharacterised protein [Gordonia terrae]|nr:Uncharacterised protein [Gordonia terrae]